MWQAVEPAEPRKSFARLTHLPILARFTERLRADACGAVGLDGRLP
jgi:hypothetical protein